jgi:hypothetical protein
MAPHDEREHRAALGRIAAAGIRACFALTIVFGVLPPPPTLAAGLCANDGPPLRHYSLEYLTSGSNGIDGYVRGSGSNLSDPMNQAIGEWVSLTTFAAPQMWVRIGQAQGCLGKCPGNPCIYTPITIHLFAENQNCNGQSYRLTDIGQTPSPNYAVYVNWAGVGPEPGFCLGQNSYEFPFRTGSWTSSPKAYGYMESSTGGLEAGLEVHNLNAFPTVGTTYFGTDNNHNVNGSYALHTYVKATNQWLLWSAGSFPGTKCHDDSPLIYDSMRQWDAFLAAGGGAVDCPNPD